MILSINESSPFFGGTSPFLVHAIQRRKDPLTAFLRVAVVADEHFLARGAEERRPVDGVVEAQAAVVEDVDVAGADLAQRLELERGDPALLQDQQRDAASAAKIWENGVKEVQTEVRHRDGDEEAAG